MRGVQSVTLSSCVDREDMPHSTVALAAVIPLCWYMCYRRTLPTQSAQSDRHAGCRQSRFIRIRVACMQFRIFPEDMPAFQALSLPVQQLVRAYNLGEMSEADRVELESWELADTGLSLHPHLADAAKNSLNSLRLQEHSRTFSRFGLAMASKTRAFTWRRF